MQYLSPIRNYSRSALIKRRLSTSFAELYRKSVESAPLGPGDVVEGHIVGQRQPRSTSSRFYVVDFGLKTETPFAAKEIPGANRIGDSLSMPIMHLEDDFNEPVFDQDRQLDLPKLQAERYELLTKVATADTRLLHGRFSNFRRVGAGVKVLGMDAFVPRHHVVSLDRPILGSYAPFYVMSMETEKRNSGNVPGLDVNPVVSSYGGFLFCLANLVGVDSAWVKSGGGTAKDRQAYLRLLTKLLHQKNSSVRRIFPKNSDSQVHYKMRRKRRELRESDVDLGDTAWLNNLSRGDWTSSKTSRQSDASIVWPKVRRQSEPRSPVRSRQPSKS